MIENNQQQNIKMKDSGIDWIEEIPSDWNFYKLRSVGQFSASGIDKLSKKTEEKVRIINFVDVYHSKNFVLQEKKYMIVTTTSQKIKTHQLQKGDLIFMPSSEVVEEIGMSALVDEYLENTAFSYHVLRFQFKNFLDFSHSFKKYMVNNYFVLSQFSSRAQGSIRKTLGRNDFKEVQILYPPVKSQQAIANFLDKKTGNIDALIEKKKKMIELLKEKITSLAMSEQVNGEGALFRIRHLTTLIERSVELRRDDEYTALGLYNRGRGLFHKPTRLGSDMGDSKFFYVKGGDFILSGQFAWEGAVAMASLTENGCVVSHRYPVLRGSLIEIEYLAALLMTGFGNFLLNESSRGSAGRNRPLNINILLSEEIRRPSTEVQEEIKKMMLLKASINEKIEKQIKLLDEYRASLIYHAVTGKINI